MAYDYNKAKEAYQSLTKEQQQQFVDQNKNDANFQRFMKDYVSEVNQNMSTRQSANNTPVTQPTEQPTQQPAQTTPEMKQETEIKQQETAGSTVPEIQQQGELKPLSQEYYNQTSDDAQSKIINNLNNYRQTNPEYFRDYESFKKNFSYDARNDEQKQTLDSWYGGYQKGMELAGIPVTDLYTQYKDGQVSMNELENLRVYDPTKYAELQNQINKGNIIAAYDDDKGVDGTGLSLQDMAYNAAMQMFTQFMSGDSSSGASQYFRDYESKMESPEMLALSDQCTEVQEQMENIQSDLDSIKKSVEKEYEGTGATRSKINAIIADRSYDLQLQLRTLNSEYNKYATQYNNRMNQYQSEFQMQLQEYQLNQQARNQQMQELGFAMDLMNFETNEQKAQREWDYWVKQQEYTNGNINSSDYQTRYKAALKSVQNLLSQYEGIPMQRSAEQMAQDILKAIDGGSDLGAELTKINKLIQGKPEYKYLYNQTYKPATSSGIDYQTFKLGDQDYIVYNGELMSASDFNARYGGIVSNGNAKPYDAVTEDAFSKNALDPSAKNLGGFLLGNPAGKKGGQCGKFVNDYLQKIGVGRYYDNDLSTKVNSVNTKVPKVGSIAVYDYGVKSSDGVNHGHVAIVTNVNSDGTYDVIDSNFGSDEKVQVRKRLSLNSTSLKGFFDPSQGAMGVSDNSTTTLSDIDRSKKENYLEEARRGQMTNTDVAKIGNIAAEQGWGEEWREALKQGQKWNLTDVQTNGISKADDKFLKNIDVKAFDEAKTQFQQLAVALEDSSGVGDMSAIFTFMKTLDPSSVVRESEFNSAAATAGVLNPQSILQSLEKSVDGKFLTPKQREDFKEIAKEFIKIKADAYQKQYENLAKKYEGLGVDIEERGPVNTAQELLKLLDKATTTNKSTNQSVQLSNTWKPARYTQFTGNNYTSNSSNLVNVGGYTFPSKF